MCPRKAPTGAKRRRPPAMLRILSTSLRRSPEHLPLAERAVSLIVAWVAFPLVLAAIAAGWGMIAQLAAGAPVAGALLLPLGLAAAIVVAGTLTAFAATAPAAAPVVAAGAAAGLFVAWPARRLEPLRRRLGAPESVLSPAAWRAALWPALAAVGVLLAYGAPVLLSGQATFAGFIRLDDTATWLNIIDHAMSHARS